MPAESANVCVFAPALFLSVTVEAAGGEDELHLHPGGQGFWIARMLRHLGERPVVVCPLGGEAGLVLRALAPTWTVDLCPIEIAEDSPAYLHDRRSGDRRELAATSLPALGRHELDDLYGRVLDLATRTGTCVLTGRPPGDSLPLDVYRRLGADLAATGVTVVGDLHGAELTAFLERGRLHTLKLSDADLVQDEALAAGASIEDRFDAVERYRRRGAERVVLSCADGPTVAGFGAHRLSAEPPVLAAVDHRGSGDAMTAGLVAAALRRLDPEPTLRFACAAGAANVTRRGLANADADLVDSLAERVRVQFLTEESA